MITVVFYMRDGRYCGFHCSGHAGFADKGKDIVCAGVSALVINCANSIDRLTKDRADIEHASDGSVFCMVKQPVSAESELLLRSLRMGLVGIYEKYRKYIRIVDEE
jgi:hypothetical protein